MTRYIQMVATALAVTLVAFPTAAWERTNQTKIAPDGTPLVLLTAEPGDMLGEPWLEYLQFIGYDTTGNWWEQTAQTLLDYNPSAEFKSGTYYGIFPDTTWWLPDIDALQASEQVVDPTPTETEDPVMRQSDFVALGDAVAEDLAGMRQLQETAAARVQARLARIEQAQVTATTEREGISATLAAISNNLTRSRSSLDELDSRVARVETNVATNTVNIQATQDQLADVQGTNQLVLGTVTDSLDQLVLALIVVAVVLTVLGVLIWLSVRRVARQTAIPANRVRRLTPVPTVPRRNAA